MVFGVSLLAGAAVKDAAADLVDEAEKDDHEDDDEADDNFDVKDGATAEGVAAVGGAKGTASTSLPNWRGGVGGFLMLGSSLNMTCCCLPCLNLATACSCSILADNAFICSIRMRSLRRFARTSAACAAPMAFSAT